MCAQMRPNVFLSTQPTTQNVLGLCNVGFFLQKPVRS